MKGSILFLRTADLAVIERFYIDQVGGVVWLRQPGCTILRFGNQLIGFCQGEQVETAGVLTFFFEQAGDVDAMFLRHGETADRPPRFNPTYRIYQFFARDPEGRVIEFQQFVHPLPPLE